MITIALIAFLSLIGINIISKRQDKRHNAYFREWRKLETLAHYNKERKEQRALDIEYAKRLIRDNDEEAYNHFKEYQRAREIRADNAIKKQIARNVQQGVTPMVDIDGTVRVAHKNIILY